MKFTTDRDVLADAVGWVARILPQRPVVPILAGMRLAAAGDSLTVAAFDYDTATQATITAETGEPRVMVVPGRLLAEIVKSLPPRPVTFTGDDTHVVITCGSSRFTLNQLPPDEYPSLPSMPATAGTAGAGVLAEAVSQVAVAAGRDDTLPALTGIHAGFTSAAITLAATDRYRLATREIPWDAADPAMAPMSALIPARVLTDAAKAMTGAAEITIGYEDGGEPADGGGVLGLSTASRRMTTRLLTGDYPEWSALIPAEFSSAAELAATEFTEAVKRVALVAERNTPIRLTFTPGQVTLEAGTPGESEASEAMDAAYDGEEMRIAFNPAYLLDGITATGTEVVRMSFTTPGRPAVITPAGDGEEPAYRYLLMPIRGTG
jgi:DNA polymerase-3 subunit beta